MAKTCTDKALNLSEEKKGFLSHGVRDELLIRIDERLSTQDEKLSSLNELLNSPVGPARCQLNHQEMEYMLKDIQDLQGSRKWFKRSIFALILSFFGKISWDTFIR